MSKNQRQQRICGQLYNVIAQILQQQPPEEQL